MRLQRYNAEAPGRGGAPLTLCSGRPEPYVEAMCQVLDVRVPALFESGAGMYDHLERRFSAHALITQTGLEALREFEGRVVREILGEFGAYLEPGNIFTSTIMMHEAGPLERLGGMFAALEALIEEAGYPLVVDHGRTCANILHRGVDKGAGFAWLCEKLGIAPGHIAAIGDAEGDLPLLAAAGWSAAPANAVPRVKELVDYVSPAPGADGVVDILREIRTL